MVAVVGEVRHDLREAEEGRRVLEVGVRGPLAVAAQGQGAGDPSGLLVKAEGQEQRR